MRPRRSSAPEEDRRTSRSIDSKGNQKVTKKAAAKKTATNAIAPVKAAPVRIVRGPKLLATKMTKTQVIRFMSEQINVPPKQVGQFFTC